MQFHNYPEYIAIEKYHNNVEAYSTHLQNLNEVLGLFSMGSISAPGLSDIDLVVVVKDTLSHAVRLSPFALNLDRKLFLHDVFVLNLNLVNHFNYIFYSTNIKPIFVKNGIRTSFPSLHSISKELKLIYLIELGKMRLDQLCAISRLRQCNVRKLITRVSSIIHSLNIADELSIKMPNNVHTYKNRILSLRRNWVKNQGASIQNIDNIFEDGLDSWSSILKAASDMLVQIGDITHNPKPSKRKFMNIRFSDQNCCRLLKDRHGCCRQVLLPKNLYYHYEGYKKPGMGKYRREQKKRLDLIRVHRQFLKKNGLTFSMTGNLGFPINRMDKVKLMIKDAKKFIPYFLQPNMHKRI